jgi:hypothetical protein
MRTRAKNNFRVSPRTSRFPPRPKVTFPNSYNEHLHVKMNWARLSRLANHLWRSQHSTACSLAPFADRSCSAREVVLFFGHWKPRKGMGGVLPAARRDAVALSRERCWTSRATKPQRRLSVSDYLQRRRSLRCTAPVWSLVRTFVLKLKLGKRARCTTQRKLLKERHVNVVVLAIPAPIEYILVACGTVAPGIH